VLLNPHVLECVSSKDSQIHVVSKFLERVAGP
jgi:hypothetical protein